MRASTLPTFLGVNSKLLQKYWAKNEWLKPLVASQAAVMGLLWMSEAKVCAMWTLGLGREKDLLVDVEEREAWAHSRGGSTSNEAPKCLSCRFFLGNLDRAAGVVSIGREEMGDRLQIMTDEMRWRADVIAATIKDISRAACFNWLIRHATEAFRCKFFLNIFCLELLSS